jgi:hypothetical protein
LVSWDGVWFGRSSLLPQNAGHGKTVLFFLNFWIFGRATCGQSGQVPIVL